MSTQSDALYCDYLSAEMTYLLNQIDNLEGRIAVSRAHTPPLLSEEQEDVLFLRIEVLQRDYFRHERMRDSLDDYTQVSQVLVIA